jgi:hypothetical protein
MGAAISLSVAAAAVAARSVGYCGVSDLIFEQQLSPSQIVRLFSFTARIAKARDPRADPRPDLRFILCAGVVVAPESEWDSVAVLAERACGGRPVTAVIAEAGAFVRQHWDQIIEIASEDAAVAA